VPFYEFECTQCKEKFEVFATLAQKEKGLAPRCPNCDGDQVRRIFDTLVLIPHGGETSAPSASGRCCGGRSQ
jgi:putative FmdB family regulatory protein